MKKKNKWTWKLLFNLKENLISFPVCLDQKRKQINNYTFEFKTNKQKAKTKHVKTLYQSSHFPSPQQLFSYRDNDHDDDDVRDIFHYSHDLDLLNGFVVGHT